MVDKTLLVYVGFDGVFLLCAGLHLFIPLFTKNSMLAPPTPENVATNLLLDHCPLTGKAHHKVQPGF